MAAAAKVSGGDTAAALAVWRLQPLQRCAAVRILPASNAPALRLPLLCQGHTRRPRRCDTRLREANTCANCRGSLVSNGKSKKWSMLGSGKHFAIGKKEARRAWHLRVDCACCTQEAIAPR